MLENPFTPLFGGKPGLFFGRDEIIKSFTLALKDFGSDYRALFITGIRGSGKTALLEHLSDIARNNGFKTIDVGAEGALHSIYKQLSGSDKSETKLEPEVELSVLGTGGKLKLGSKTESTQLDESDIDLLLQKAAKKNPGGILITIDEVQKMPIDEVSVLCNAFQLASRKGCNVAICMAGLPYAYKNIIHHEGATFLRRGAHAELTLLMPDEVDAAFTAAFSSIKKFKIAKDAQDKLVNASMGQPYLMQLLGYCAVVAAEEKGNTPAGGKAKKYSITADDTDEIISLAVSAYKTRALRPITEELTSAELKYLVAVAQNSAPGVAAKAQKVADLLNRKQNQISSTRAALLNYGLIISPGHGEVMLTVPYLRDYLLEDAPKSNMEVALKTWQV